VDELLPLSAYHRHSDELLEQGIRWGGAVSALLGGAAFLLSRSDQLGVGVVLGSVLAGVGSYAAWVVFWGGSMKRLHRWQATRVYEEESRIAPNAPAGPSTFRLPMCVDLSSRSKPTGGTLFVSPDRFVFVPNRDQKGAPTVTIQSTDVRIEVREWLDAPRAMRGLRHRHSQLDIVGPGGTHSFLTLQTETVADELRRLLPSAGGLRSAIEAGSEEPGGRSV